MAAERGASSVLSILKNIDPISVNEICAPIFLRLVLFLKYFIAS